eukprot:jgi/Chrpa1/6868/Chrysochromulina_OHIO_Genome00012085-RA
MGVLFEGYLQRRWSEHSPIEETFFALEGAEGRNVFLVLYPRAPVNGEDDCTVPEQALSLAGSWITPASDAIDPQCKRVKLFGFQLCFLPATGHGVVVSRLELFADSEDEAREWVLRLVSAGARGDAELYDQYDIDVPIVSLFFPDDEPAQVVAVRGCCYVLFCPALLVAIMGSALLIVMALGLVTLVLVCAFKAIEWLFGSCRGGAKAADAEAASMSAGWVSCCSSFECCCIPKGRSGAAAGGCVQRVLSVLRPIGLGIVGLLSSPLLLIGLLIKGVLSAVLSAGQAALGACKGGCCSKFGLTCAHALTKLGACGTPACQRCLPACVSRPLLALLSQAGAWPGATGGAAGGAAGGAKSDVEGGANGAETIAGGAQDGALSLKTIWERATQLGGRFCPWLCKPRPTDYQRLGGSSDKQREAHVVLGARGPSAAETRKPLSRLDAVKGGRKPVAVHVPNLEGHPGRKPVAAAAAATPPPLPAAAGKAAANAAAFAAAFPPAAGKGKASASPVTRVNRP